MWVFDGNDTLVTDSTGFTVNLSEGYHSYCAYIVWSIPNSVNCCCVDTICGKIDVSPCSLQNVNILTLDSVNGVYTFAPSTTGGTIGSYNYSMIYSIWSINNGPGTNTTIFTDSVHSSGYQNICLTVAYIVTWPNGKDECKSNICEDIWLNGPVQKSKMQLYPNPASGFVTVIITNNDNVTESKLELYDAVGQAVLQKNVSLQKGNNTFYLNLENLPKGVYQVRSLLGTSTEVSKLIKE
jgi:hypothetical protein